MVNPTQAAFSGLKYIYITFNIYCYSIFPPKLRPPGLILVACLASRLYRSVFLSRLDLFLFAMTHCFLSCFCFLQWIRNKHEHPGWKIHPLMKYMKLKQQQQQSKCLVSPGIYKQAPCCRFSIIQELFFPPPCNQTYLPSSVYLSVSTCLQGAAPHGQPSPCSSRKGSGFRILRRPKTQQIFIEMCDSEASVWVTWSLNRQSDTRHETNLEFFFPKSITKIHPKQNLNCI